MNERDFDRIDFTTNALTTINYDHHEIHDGEHYLVNSFVDLDINEVLDMTFQTPDTTSWCHWTFNIDAESETKWYVYEGATVSNALANTITPVNNNRNSDNVSAVTLKYEVQTNLSNANTDTNVASATTLESGILGAKKDIGTDSREHEIILKQNTIYCLRGIATVAGYLDFRMQWYEHTNKLDLNT